MPMLKRLLEFVSIIPKEAGQILLAAPAGQAANGKIDPSSQLGAMFVLPHGRWLDRLLVWSHC